MTDLSLWFSEPDTARRLGVSERTLRTWAGQGKRPERRFRPRPGGKPQPVYNPRDVEEMETPRAMILPPEKPPAETAVASAWNFSALTPFLERLTAVIERRLEPPKAPTPWLSMSEAAKIAGLSESLLRRLVRTGRLGYLRDREGWKVRRADLENLEASRLHEVTTELRAAVAARRNGQ